MAGVGKQDLKDDGFGLARLEVWWRDRAVFLESRGYRLRPRFLPDWKPSWAGRDLNPFSCEDGLRHLIRKVMDATRISDGRVVAIKQVPADSPEIELGEMLSTSESLKDPLNHCVPILDHFTSPDEPDLAFIVMPLLRAFDDPEFFDISEVLDFMSQTLEGTVYIHRRSVAHRDLSYLNIMMAADPLFPRGFHPSHPSLLPNGTDFVDPLRRRDVGYVKYYIIDFGLSLHYDDPEIPRIAYGQDGQDKEVPELQAGSAYDPFKKDIFTLGHLFEKQLLNKYTNINLISPLVTSMTNEDPDKRPSAEEALEQFKDIRSRVKGLRSLWRLRRVDETKEERLLLDAHAAFLILIMPFVYLLKLPSRAIRCLLSGLNHILRQAKNVLTRRRKVASSYQVPSDQS